MKIGKFNPEGVSDFLPIFLDRLMSRRLVACFDDYELAKEEVLIELLSSVGGNATFNDLKELVTAMEGIMYIEDWFNGLGKSKGKK